MQAALAAFDGMWAGLPVADRCRLLSLLLEQVTYDGEPIALTFRQNGLAEARHGSSIEHQHQDPLPAGPRRTQADREGATAPPPPRPEPVPRQARLMALAIHFDRLLRQGAVGSYLELARLTGTSPAWITAIMKLADLPVPRQERVLLWTGLEESKPPTVSPAACGAAVAPHRPRRA